MHLATDSCIACADDVTKKGLKCVYHVNQEGTNLFVKHRVSQLQSNM